MNIILRKERCPRKGKESMLFLERSSFTKLRHLDSEAISMLNGVCKISSFSDSCSGIS